MPRTPGSRIIACSLLLLEALGLSTATAAKVTLVESGKAKCSIVLRPMGKPTPTEVQAYADEKAAAEDFARVIEVMTGVRLAIASSPQAGLLPVYIGEAATAEVPDLAATLKHPDPLTLVNDRFLIDASEKRLVLVGARPWATRLAVTQCLEDLGCRWYGGGAFFEVIPQIVKVTLAAGRKIHTPDFEMRDFWYVADADLAHLKLNRHDEVLNCGHSWDGWIGKERAARPELRGLVEGERTGPLEYAHPDVPAIFARNILAQLDRTGQRTVSVSTDDGPVYSESKESQAWLLREPANPYTAAPAITDAVLRFLNKVFPVVLAKHPDTVFGFLVYGNTMTPPRYEAVHPSLAIVAAPLAENALVPTPGTSDPRRSHFRKCLETWMKLAKRGYIYEYDPFVIWHGVLSPQVELVRRNIPYYKSIGIRGFNMESRDAAFGESGLNILVSSRLFWDAKTDVDAVLDEYCWTFYGPAAKSMRKWIRITQEAILHPVAPVFGNEDHNIELIFTPAVMSEAGKAMEKAEASAKAEPWKTRVHVARLIHDHLAAYLQSKDAMDRGEFTEAVDAIDRMGRIKDELHLIEPTLANPKRWDLASESPPWIGGLRKQATHWASLAGQRTADSEGSLIQMLPQNWTFAFDSENLGMTQGWASSDKWPNAASINIGQPWDYQGHSIPIMANGWYRTSVTVPPASADRPIRLYFTRVYGMKMDVWLDGKLIEHRDLPRYFWFDYHHEREFDLTSAVVPGKTQTLTVRIFKEFDWGGPYGAIFLYSPKDANKPLEGK